MLIGHQKQWQFFKKSAELESLSHAYLFAGQEKLGKKTLAIEFSKWFLKEDILRKDHPDFIFIEPVNKEIQISQIRNLIWRLSLKPFLTSFKVAIIDSAHCLNQEAQNCFLKTLEEPKGKALIFLISEYPEFLFPTILSRCEIIKFYPVPKAEIEKYLKEQKIEEKEAKAMAYISQGSPGKAIDFLKEPQKLKERNKTINEFSELIKSDLASRFKYAKALSEKPDLKEVLSIWLFYIRENLICQLNSCQNTAKLKHVAEKIQNTIFLISNTNINSRLALETLMIEL